MNLYDALADIYGDIFPLSAERVEFVCSLLPQHNAHIMDVGCATGDLALALARRNIRVTAIDRNKKMINIVERLLSNKMSDGLPGRTPRSGGIREIGC